MPWFHPGYVKDILQETWSHSSTTSPCRLLPSRKHKDTVSSRLYESKPAKSLIPFFFCVGLEGGQKSSPCHKTRTAFDRAKRTLVLIYLMICEYCYPLFVKVILYYYSYYIPTRYYIYRLMQLQTKLISNHICIPLFHNYDRKKEHY